MSVPASEYQARAARAQALMVEHQLDALLLTTGPDILYLTGFLTRFWESPTRPWFVILPATGAPVAVIPAIGAPLMARGWVTDIRTWAAPDLSDDGVTLLGETLRALVPECGMIGLPMGHETHLRMPLGDFHRLQQDLGQRTCVPDFDILRHLRAIKSEAEIALIRTACAIAGRAFDRVPEVARVGIGLDQVFRGFQRLCLEEGADWVPYLAGAAEPGGYRDVISPATSAPLAAGDVLMLDTGLVHQGYFCDFDRNFSVGPPSPSTVDAHTRLIAATEAGLVAARPGATAADVFHVMNAICQDPSPRPGRFGHGLGLQLTEGLSILPSDSSVLRAGMVLTLEPCVTLDDGRIMVHEENIVLRDHGAEWLTRPAGPDIPVIGDAA
ncbi:Xaa-Pro peptidase family protein [Puniceibacterium sp. IMCC21224]|uniref:M24 family metallopeptidase n=1 Tax=Puniceibacterium sp. IMCC21224 TaxID=1618204 RepID=UPI00065D333A|nr:Xaa-Pro peptidase family protein [Puniceibacterium sp. IMCC21224]KMK66175.1 Xaa-Pro aminopeptidase [Puniceibacterium sp. IMCC21224]